MDLADSRKLLLLVFAVLALALTASSAHAASCRGTGAQPGMASTRTLNRATLCLLNVQRRAHGRHRLRADHALGRAANGFAYTMVRHHFFDHVSPSGSTMMARVRAAAYLRRTGSYSIGENIAWGAGSLGTPRAIVRAWMHSAGHRANILNPRFRDVGIGMAPGVPSGHYWGGTYVTDFGTKH